MLKGPASFLFGRADPGGLINLVTKKPLDVPYYSLTQEFGSFNLYRTVFDLTGPVAVPALPDGAVSYRFSGSYTNGGQFIDFLKDRNVFLAPAITWKIGPATTLTVEAEYRHQDAVSNVGIPAIGMYPASLPSYRSFLEPNEPPDTVRGALISEEFKHSFDKDWAITSRFLAARTTITKADLTANGLEADGVTLDRGVLYQKLPATNYSTNLDLTGKFNVLGARNDILIGADCFYRFFNYTISADGNFPINIYNPVYGTVPTSAFTSAAFKAWSGTADQFISFSSRAAKDLGIYAQDSITLFDNLHVLLGGRYDFADVRAGFGRTFDIASTKFRTNPNRHDEAFSPRVGLVYQPVPWIGFYGSYTKSLGQNNGSATVPSIAPQIAVGWEGGVKTELLDGRLAATLAFFTITKSNVLTRDLASPNPLARKPIGETRSQGVEFDALGKITDELSVIASYAHIDAKVIVDNGGLLGKSPMSFAPNSGSLFLASDFPTDSLLHGWRVGGGVYAASNRWGDDQNTFILPAYARLDAFANYQFTAAGARWSAQINVKNIVDTKYYPGNDFFFNNDPRFGIFPGAPRAITSSLRVEY